MTIAFITPTILDINMILFMGVSIKENENPIGFFGTGLKYAIAVLLRTGHEIEIHVDDIRYTFHATKITLRGTEQDAILMRDNSIGGKPDITLPFTLNYGRQWEVWMAYRELVTNTMDEHGFVQKGEKHPGPGHTVILVSGEEIDKCHSQHNHYFLKPNPIGVLGMGITVHKHKGQPAIYYRGVLVNNTFGGSPARFSYAFDESLTLTEDRTLKHPHNVFCQIGQYVVGVCSDPVLIEKMITFAPVDTFESNLDYDWTSVSPTFIDVVARMIETDSSSVAPSALRAYCNATKDKGIKTEPFTSMQHLILDRAIGLLKRCGYKDIERYPILHMVNASSSTMGRADDDKIYLTDRAFAYGTKTVMATILEEYYHLSEGVDDCSREFQDLLLTQIINVYEEHLLKEAI